MIYSDVHLNDLPDFAFKFLEEMIKDEGEWSDDENDWPTKWGIRQLIADKYGYIGRLKDLSYNDAFRMWALHSWYEPRYDLIAQQSYLCAKHIMDTSGPAGDRQATRHLQELLNGFNDPHKEASRYGSDLKVDGLIGLNTSERLRQYLDHRGVIGDGVLAVAINAFQLNHFRATANKNIGKRDFIFGWYHRRVYEDLLEIFEYMKTATRIKRHGDSIIDDQKIEFKRPVFT